MRLQKDNAEVAPAVPAAQVAPAPARKVPCEWRGHTFNANMIQQMFFSSSFNVLFI
jgi:hypothetical protein